VAADGVAVEVLDLAAGSSTQLAGFHLRAAEADALGGKSLSWME
jgi:hypothetical protein